MNQFSEIRKMAANYLDNLKSNTQEGKSILFINLRPKFK